MQILADALMMVDVTTSPTNHDLTVRLIQHCTFSSRFPNKILFFDYSFKKVGHSSFVNRAKFVSKLIPFEWIDTAPIDFKRLMTASTPIYIRCLMDRLMILNLLEH